MTCDSSSLSVIIELPLADGAFSSVVCQGVDTCAKDGFNRLDLPYGTYLRLISQAVLPVH